MKNSCLFVITHKPYQMPPFDLYVPLHVGKKGKPELGYQGDDTGINISEKNPYYCELTGLYWIWKNEIFKKYDYLGIVHYRRYFEGSILFDKNKIMSCENLNSIMSVYDAILPKKRCYFIETIEQHYKHAHVYKDLLIVREVIEQNFPEYINSFNKVMKSRSMYRFNMFVFKRDDFVRYVEWLFDILFKSESKINYTRYNNYQKRVFGFLAERLLNVWIEYNKLNVYACKTVNIEKEPVIKKAINMVLRKMKLTSY